MNRTSFYGDTFSNVRVLVTGGAGFIGSHLVDALVGLGATVVVVDDLSTGRVENLAGQQGRIDLVESSIMDREQMIAATAGCRYVFHLAALGSVPASIDDPSHCFLTNLNGSISVLEAARAAGVHRVVLAGSASAYGETGGGQPKQEGLLPAPLSPYAASKLAMEHAAKVWCTCYGLDTICLRYFNVFGPRQRVAGAYGSVIPRFIDAFMADRKPVVHGDGMQSRDFTYVQNVVNANLLAASRPGPLGGVVVNIGTGRSVTIRSLFDQLAVLCNWRGGAPGHGEKRAGDLDHSLADVSLAREVIGYEPETSLEVGLGRTVKWWRQRSEE